MSVHPGALITISSMHGRALHSRGFQPCFCQAGIA